MNIYIKDDMLCIAQSGIHYRTIVSWGKFRYVKRDQTLRGPIDLDALDKLAKITVLPKPIDELRVILQRRRVAIDTERRKNNPVPLVNYPVKRSLYAHQVKGANMALIAFGVIVPTNRAEENK